MRDCPWQTTKKGVIILKKRINILLIGVFSALFILAGCGKGTVKETELYQKVQASGPENTLGTVLFLGYHETIDEKLVSELPQALAELPLIQMGGGEIYAIIPRYEGETITLNSVLWSEERGEPVQQEPGTVYDTAILVACNESDIFSNIVVTLTMGKESVSFSPYISLMDGSIITDERVPVGTL